ncbi:MULTISPECIES: hypothetical protein [unclassified Moorena]|uniref:hypothetical protein n=1 Tax=unclassified Moorena TaxID=2683338 RepID=UPI0025F41053|nr:MULTISPECIES: hypothetical protein [unclassified Moorena]
MFHSRLQAMYKTKGIKLALGLALTTMTSGLLLLWESHDQGPGVFQFLGAQPAVAQFFIPPEISKVVYQRLPDLPQENQYISKESGKVAANNTLVNRLIRYHVYGKKRLPNFRFDWKLTMADYLGAYDYLEASQYPSGDTLTENPMEGDIAAIEQLTRAERDALVSVLVNIFNPNRSETVAPESSTQPSPATTSNPTSPATTSNPRRGVSLPKPGDAQLLKPN